MPLDQVLLALVLGVELPGVVGIDEVVLLPGDEEGWHEGLVDVFDGLDVGEVELGLLLDGGLDELEGDGEEESRHLLRVLAEELFGEDGERGEARVEDEASDGGIAVSVEKSRHCAHGAAPQSYGADPPRVPQVGNHSLEVFSLVEAERDVLSLRETRAREVETEERHVHGEDEGDAAKGLETRAGVSVKVDDAGELVCRSLGVERLEVRTLNLHFPLILEREVSSLEGAGADSELVGPHLINRVGIARRTDNGLPQILVASLLRLLLYLTFHLFLFDLL